MKHTLIFSMSLALAATGYAGTATISGSASILDANDSGGSDIPLDALVLFVVETASSGTIADLVASNGVSIANGTSLAVGNTFNDYEIIGFTNAPAAGVVGPGNLLVTVDEPGTEANAGDPFAIIWFGGITVADGDTSYTVGSADNGADFGVATVSGNGVDGDPSNAWTLPASGGTKQFSSNVGSTQLEQVASAQADKSITVIPEPAATAGLLGLAGLFAIRRFR